MRALIAAAVVALSLAASVSAHDGVKRVFLPDSAGTAENPSIDGCATPEYDRATTLRLDLRNLAANMTYGIMWPSDGPTLNNAAAFTTNRQGKGRYANFVVGLATRNVVITHSVNGADSFGFAPEEARAVGIAQDAH